MRLARVALAVFAVHFVLLFFPPLPPLWKGSIWSYILGYLAVILAARAHSAWGPVLAEWWTKGKPTVRWVQGLVVLAAIAGFGVLVRTISPDVFARFSREEGIWEPLTLIAYISSWLLLFRAASREDGEPDKHLRLVAAGFVFLTLEEIDYFGIFGGVIGRIEGVYVGSLHDLISLGAAGLLPTWVTGVLAVGAVAGGIVLFTRGYVQPARLMKIMMSFQLIWLVMGAGFLGLAASEESQLFGVSFGFPTPEEMIELLGGLSLAAFGFEAYREGVAATRPS